MGKPVRRGPTTQTVVLDRTEPGRIREKTPHPDRKRLDDFRIQGRSRRRPDWRVRSGESGWTQQAGSREQDAPRCQPGKRAPRPLQGAWAVSGHWRKSGPSPRWRSASPTRLAVTGSPPGVPPRTADRGRPTARGSHRTRGGPVIRGPRTGPSLPVGAPNGKRPPRGAATDCQRPPPGAARRRWGKRETARPTMPAA